MSEPCDLSAVDARAAIDRRELSPVELLESCIRRIEQVDPAINAMVARDFTAARNIAAAQEQQLLRDEPLPPLFGLPIAVKDLIDATGLPTTYGSLLFADNIAKGDEAIVAMLRKAGAIIIGKTNTPEWGAGGNTRNALHGATGNPFNTSLTAAGSSGGSAAAVACGMVPLATGSDTGGSLRNPAAYCGVVGFRPSPGLVASNSRNMAWLQLSQLGPMARNTADAALMLSAMLEQHQHDPQSVIYHADRVPAPVGFANPQMADLSTLRVALTPDFGFAPTAKSIRRSFEQKCSLFRSAFAGHQEATPDCRHADRVFEVLRAVLFLDRHRMMVEQYPDKIGPNIHRQVNEGLGYSAADVADALTKQTAMYRAWQDFFKDSDILIAPSVTISPRPWSELYPSEIDGQPTRNYFHWLALAYAVTNVGHPSISIPAGRDAYGMPFGIQIIGPRGGDKLVLSVACALEAVFAGQSALMTPKVDIESLAMAKPIAGMHGFRAAD